MFKVTKVVGDKSSAPSKQTVSKKVVVAVVSFLLICIAGTTLAGLMFYPPDSQQDVDKTQSGDAQSQAAPITTSSQLDQAVEDATTFGKIKHYVLANPPRTAAITLAAVVVLVGIIVVLVPLATRSKAATVCNLNAPVDAEKGPHVETTHQTETLGDEEKKEEGMTAEILSGVGLTLTGIAIIIGIVFVYHWRSELSPSGSKPSNSDSISGNVNYQNPPIANDVKEGMLPPPAEGEVWSAECNNFKFKYFKRDSKTLITIEHTGKPRKQKEFLLAPIVPGNDGLFKAFGESHPGQFCPKADENGKEQVVDVTGLDVPISMEFFMRTTVGEKKEFQKIKDFKIEFKRVLDEQ